MFDMSESLEASPVTAPLTEAYPGVWGTLRDAIRGVPLDYTTAPVGRAVIMLAVPMVIEMAMESIFAVADVFWVAHLGADAVATVGLTESMLTMIYTVAMGLSIGAMALVSRRIGQQDAEGASRAAAQSILLGVAVSALIALLAAPRAADLLRVMGASSEVIESGSGFTRVMLGGNITVVLLFLINAVFRGAGDAAIAMRVLWFGNLLNIVLGPCFIFGLGPFPELGVTGAAVATNIGRGSAVVYQLVVLVRGRGRVRLRLEHLGLDLSLMRSVLRLSGPARSRSSSARRATSAWCGFCRSSAATRWPATPSAFASSSSRSCRRSASATRRRRWWGRTWARAVPIGRSVRCGRRRCYNMLFLGSVGLLFFLAARPIAGLFTNDPGGAAVRDRLPAHRQPRLRVLRRRHGADAVVQRRR